jgi:hypothetical protein
MKTMICLLAAWLSISLQGCASYTDDAHPMSQGWRVAHVDHVVQAHESTPLVTFGEDCRYVVDGADWMLVHYRRPPGEVYRVVHGSASDFKEGQEIYVQVDDCAVPLTPR